MLPPSRTANRKTDVASPSTLAFAAMQAVVQTSGPTDPQIAAIVVTANQVDIDAGKLAEKRALSHEVKAFAKQMVVDHSGVNKSATALVTKLKVTPEDNATSEALHKGSQENIKHLKNLRGAACDRAYIDNRLRFPCSLAVVDAGQSRATAHSLCPI